MNGILKKHGQPAGPAWPICLCNEWVYQLKTFVTVTKGRARILTNLTKSTPAHLRYCNNCVLNIIPFCFCNECVFSTYSSAVDALNTLTPYVNLARDASAPFGRPLASTAQEPYQCLAQITVNKMMSSSQKPPDQCWFTAL